MKKILMELLTLVWKFLKTAGWKWARKHLARYAVMGLIAFGVTVVLLGVLFRAC